MGDHLAALDLLYSLVGFLSGETHLSGELGDLVAPLSVRASVSNDVRTIHHKEHLLQRQKRDTKVSKKHIYVFPRLFCIRWPENLCPGGFCFRVEHLSTW